MTTYKDREDYLKRAAASLEAAPPAPVSVSVETVHGRATTVRRFAMGVKAHYDSVLFDVSARGVIRPRKLDDRLQNKGREWKGRCLLHTDTAILVPQRERDFGGSSPGDPLALVEAAIGDGVEDKPD